MLSALVITTLVQVSAPPQELAPGMQYDPAIPTLEAVVGHDFRESVTPPDQIIRYMEALARAAPRCLTDTPGGSTPRGNGPTSGQQFTLPLG